MELFYVLLVLLVATRACGEIALRTGQPVLVGELLAGIGLGVVVSRYELPGLSGLAGNEVFVALTDLGIFFLMLLAGIELEPRKLARASRGAFLVAIAGFLLPLALGFGLGWAFIPDSYAKVAQCLFLGTALAITAIPVAVKALMDLGQLESRVGQTIVSAAVFDDVLSLVLLTVLVAVIRTGAVPGPAELSLIGLKVAGFFAITLTLGVVLAPHLGWLLTRIRIAEFEFSALLIAALAYAVLAELLGLHFVVGAFVAGLFFTRRITSRELFESVKGRLSGVTSGFLAPIFFASIGMQLDVEAATAVPTFLVLLIAAAFVGKLAGAGLAARALGMGRRESFAVGMGMSGRGAVELIIAEIALQAGLFSIPSPTPLIVEQLFSAVVIMAVVTTLATPLALQHTLRRGQPDPERPSHLDPPADRGVGAGPDA